MFERFLRAKISSGTSEMPERKSCLEISRLASLTSIKAKNRSAENKGKRENLRDFIEMSEMMK